MDSETRSLPFAEAEHAVAILFEALRLTGEDTSSYDNDWRQWRQMRVLPDMARELREAVRQLRRDYDDACEELQRPGIVR